MWRIYKKSTHTFERVSTNCHSRKVTDCSWMHIVQRVISFIAFIVLHSIVEFCSQFRFFLQYVISCLRGEESYGEKKWFEKDHECLTMQFWALLHRIITLLTCFLSSEQKEGPQAFNGKPKLISQYSLTYT